MITRLLRLVGRWARKPVNHTSWVAVVTPTDRPKSVRNRCVIELFCGVVCVVTLPIWHFCCCRGFFHKTESDLFLFLLRNKKRNIVWFVGNCRTASRREDYARTLGKNYEIYIIGNCGINGNECPQNDAKSCMTNLLNNEYKFYFSAENSLCRDYITEKSFERMQYNVIPFVRGGANYSMFLPPGSYIDAGSFNNQSETCNYLLKVGKNEKLYNEYHIWRQNYKVTNYDFGHERPWREFCMRLHNEDKYRRLYRNMKDWWRGKQSTSGNMCSWYCICFHRFNSIWNVFNILFYFPISAYKNPINCFTIITSYLSTIINSLYIIVLQKSKTKVTKLSTLPE